MCGARRCFGSFISTSPRRYRAVSEALSVSKSLEVAFVDDLAAELARRRADVQDVIGGAHHLRVVLDDEHCVADVAQVVQAARISRSLSRGCRPMEGSSST